MSNKNPKLTMAQRERLSILAEECAEVIVVVNKILRHGFTPTAQGVHYNNRNDLEIEIGDVMEASQRLIAGGDIHQQMIEDRAREKAVTRQQYLHYQ